MKPDAGAKTIKADAPAEGAQGRSVNSLQILTRQEAARLLTVGVSTIRKWQREGLLPTTRLGARVGVRVIDVDQFIRENTTVSSSSSRKG